MKTQGHSDTTTIYLFPGLGSDERLFSEITYDKNVRVVNVVLPVPQKKTTMAEYARVIAQQIDTNGNYIFIGVSLGGMVCIELAEFLNPQKIILISSAKCRSELPFHYRFQKNIPINRIVPGWLTKIGAQALQPIVEPDRKKFKAIFKSMLKSKSPVFYKRTVNLIINWNRTNYKEGIVHIHGDNDHTLPVRNVKADHVIENGSHMMALTRAKEISTLINQILLRP